MLNQHAEGGQTEFQPKHVQPFTLAQAIELEVPILMTEITRLQNSISHLKTSNAEIWTYMDEEADEEDKREFGVAWTENEGVIAAQTERIQIIRLALQRKLGGEQASSLEHYGFEKGTVEGVLRGPGGASHEQVVPGVIEGDRGGREGQAHASRRARDGGTAQGEASPRQSTGIASSPGTGVPPIATEDEAEGGVYL